MSGDEKHINPGRGTGRNGASGDPSGDVSARIPDWKLERFLLGELPDAEMAAVRQAIEKDEGVRVRVEALERSNQELLDSYPPGRMGPRIRARSEGALMGQGVPASDERRGWRFELPRPLVIPVALAAIVIVAIISMPGIIGEGPPGTGIEITRLKGEDAPGELRLYRKTADGSERLAENDVAVESDLIRLQYRSDDHRYGVIVSGAGNRRRRSAGNRRRRSAGNRRRRSAGNRRHTDNRHRHLPRPQLRARRRPRLGDVPVRYGRAAVQRGCGGARDRGSAHVRAQ
jgi:hypothetical protein